MRMYIITPKNTIDYGAEGVAATLQTARFLLTTILNSCPMDREFGWEPPVDELSETAVSLYSARIIELLERNISGLRVEDVIFEGNILEGTLIPRVKVVIENESSS